MTFCRRAVSAICNELCTCSLNAETLLKQWSALACVAQCWIFQHTMACRSDVNYATDLPCPCCRCCPSPTSRLHILGRGNRPPHIACVHSCHRAAIPTWQGQHRRHGSIILFIMRQQTMCRCSSGSISAAASAPTCCWRSCSLCSPPLWACSSAQLGNAIIRRWSGSRGQWYLCR